MNFRASITCNIGRYGSSLEVFSKEEFLSMREALARASASASADDAMFLSRLQVLLFGRYDAISNILDEYETIHH